MQKRVFRVYFHTCFLCVHGRAWYPFLPFEWAPGQKIRFQALWKTKSFVKVCLKFKLLLWTKGLLIHLSPLWHFPRWHNFPVYSKLMIYRLPPLMFLGMLVIMTTLLCIERIPLSHIKTRSVVLRGYCTPGQFLDCFCIFLKNYNTLVTSKICFS